MNKTWIVSKSIRYLSGTDVFVMRGFHDLEKAKDYALCFARKLAEELADEFERRKPLEEVLPIFKVTEVDTGCEGDPVDLNAYCPEVFECWCTRMGKLVYHDPRKDMK